MLSGPVCVVHEVGTDRGVHITQEYTVFDQMMAWAFISFLALLTQPLNEQGFYSNPKTFSCKYFMDR